MDLEFVDATRDDHEAIADLWFRAQAARRPGSFVTIRDARTLVAERALLPDARFILACEGGKTVGIAYVGPGRANDGTGLPIRGLLHVSTIAVEPSQWGRGIGTEIVGHVLEVARERGARRIQFWTQADNLRAQRLYERLGFARNGREKRDIRGESIVQYQLALEPTSHQSFERQT